MEDRYDKISAGPSTTEEIPETGTAAEKEAPQRTSAKNTMKTPTARNGSRHDALLPVSVVGGLVGMLVGTLPATICSLIFGRAFSPLYVFLPLFIYLGIKIFKGYSDRRGVIMVAIFSALGFYLTLLSCQAAAYVLRYQMFILNIPLVTISLIGQANVLRGPAFSSAYILPLVFALLGIFLSEELMMRKKEPVSVPEPEDISET